jgi:hypothetical protein
MKYLTQKPFAERFNGLNPLNSNFWKLNYPCDVYKHISKCNCILQYHILEHIFHLLFLFLKIKVSLWNLHTICMSVYLYNPPYKISNG